MKCAIDGIIAIVILATMAGCGGSGGSSAGGGATPDATFDNFKSGMQKKDYRTAFSQTTPETQDIVIGTMTLVASMAAMGDPNVGADLQKVLDKHGVAKMDSATPPAAGADPMAGMKQMSAGVKDKPACIAEIMGILEKSANTKGGSAGPNFDELAAATLVDVKVDGDKASGTIKTKKGDEEKSQPVKFKKVGDLWFMDMTEFGPGGAGPAN